MAVVEGVWRLQRGMREPRFPYIHQLQRQSPRSPSLLQVSSWTEWMSASASGSCVAFCQWWWFPVRKKLQTGAQTWSKHALPSDHAIPASEPVLLMPKRVFWAIRPKYYTGLLCVLVFIFSYLQWTVNQCTRLQSVLMLENLVVEKIKWNIFHSLIQPLPIYLSIHHTIMAGSAIFFLQRGWSPRLERHSEILSFVETMNEVIYEWFDGVNMYLKWL